MTARWFQSRTRPLIFLWSYDGTRTPRVLIHDPQHPEGRAGSNFDSPSGICSQTPEPREITEAQARRVFAEFGEPVAAGGGA